MRIAQFAITVREYDEAIEFYTRKLGFDLVEDTDLGSGKRWVRLASPHDAGLTVLLAKAVTPAQVASVGNQTGGRVFIFLETDNFDRDHTALRERGVRFTGPVRREQYGTVAVFEDLYGNRFDLIGPNRA